MNLEKIRQNLYEVIQGLLLGACKSDLIVLLESTLKMFPKPIEDRIRSFYYDSSLTENFEAYVLLEILPDGEEFAYVFYSAQEASESDFPAGRNVQRRENVPLREVRSRWPQAFVYPGRAYQRIQEILES